MKTIERLILVTIVAVMIAGCNEKTSDEERYIYQEEKILDTETGDEYIMEDDNEFTIIYTDGSKEKIAIEDTPFYGNALSDEFVTNFEAKLAERKEVILLNMREKLKETRRTRYANHSDDQLLEKFQNAHAEGIDMGLQIDMIAELIERGKVTEEDAPEYLELSPELIDFDLDIEAPKKQ
jgi:hypothetical protein